MSKKIPLVDQDFLQQALRDASDEIQRLRERVEKLEADVDLERQMVSALKHSVVATVGGTDYEGNPTSSINYLQRLRILVDMEKTLHALTGHQQ